MKKILVSLLLLLSANHASAEVIATTPNQAGGNIYFTDTQCAKKGEFWKIVYATLSGGETIWGCWFFDDPMVHVQWDSGKTTAYVASTLTITKKNKNAYKY